MTTDINMATDMGTDIDIDMDVKKYHKNADRILLQHRARALCNCFSRSSPDRKVGTRQPGQDSQDRETGARNSRT
jgi:hypothetical protein